MSEVRGALETIRGILLLIAMPTSNLDRFPGEFVKIRSRFAIRRSDSRLSGTAKLIRSELPTFRVQTY